MSKLEELILELCPDGVEFKDLEKCCEILDNQRKPVTRSYRVSGIYPYYGANGIQDYVSDYIFEGSFVLVGEDGSVMTSDGKPVVNWAEGKIWVNNHAHVIKEKDGVVLRYLFHYLQTVDVMHLVHGNIPKLTGKDFRAIKIPVPPLKVQAEIVRILDTFTNLISELNTELILRRKQFQYYRDQLLTFGSDVEFVSLGDVAEIRSGFGFPNIEQGKSFGDLPFYKVGDMNHPENARYMTVADNYISFDTAKKLKCIPAPKDTVIFPKIGAAIATNKKRMLTVDSCYDNNVMGLSISHFLQSRSDEIYKL